jgi:hypothetical protein
VLHPATQQSIAVKAKMNIWIPGLSETMCGHRWNKGMTRATLTSRSDCVAGPIHPGAILIGASQALWQQE